MGTGLPLSGVTTAHLHLAPWGAALADPAARKRLEAALKPMLTAELRAHLPTPLSAPPDDIAAWIAAADRTAEVATIAARDGGQLAGLLLLHATSDSPDINVGYFIAASHRGRGFATEALLGLANAIAGVAPRRLVAGTDADNTASIRSLEKAGFQRIDTTGDHPMFARPCAAK